MTTRCENHARVPSCLARTLFRRGLWTPARLLFLGILLTAPVLTRAQNLGNFCPYGTCDITDPHYVNVYWDSSLAQWDTDVAANTTNMAHDHLDHLTEALINSKYFSALTQYSVTSATQGDSISTAGCMAPPSDLDTARNNLGNLANCIVKLYPSLKKDNTILNVFVPPQSAPASVKADFCSKFAGEHGQYGSPVGVTFNPTNSACNGSLGALFNTLTHEMSEATTDPNPPSPTGWKVHTTGDFFGQEVSDVCQSLKMANTGFLFAGTANNWSNGASSCVSGFTLTAPTITTATSCGTGQAMTLTLTGAFGGTPWDLASKKFGTQTLYLNARINHGGKLWDAGNFEGLPSDSVNNGKPDVVHFGASGVSWSPGKITVGGFDNNYGKTMANGALAEVSPGDPIVVKVALNDTGQFASTSITAPGVSQILNLAVNPIYPDPWIFVNAKANVTGTAADPGKCGVQKQTVSFMAFQGSISPGQAATSSTGTFQADYFAPAVAGTQKATATLSKNNAISSSVNVPVHPILNSVAPNVGPVAGGQNVTLSGDGFDPGNTSVDFSGAAAKTGTIALQSIQAVTPKSPLGGDGDGTVDVTATVNGLPSLSVAYQYILPGKPYISYKSTNCKTHYIVVTVYDDNAKPVNAPIKLTANYQAYFVNGSWTTNTNTTTGVWVQVDKGGPFTATNTNKNLSSTATFPFLPEVVCDNVKLITKVDWHIFEKTNPLDPVEISQFNPETRVKGGVKKVVIWTKSANVKDATDYVLDPAGSARGGGIQVSTVGAERFRTFIHGGIFLGGGMKTESAPGQQAGNVREVQFAGPAFSITGPGQRGDAPAPLGRQLRVSFGIPLGAATPHTFHIAHLTMVGGAPTWIEDGPTQMFSYNSGITRLIDQSGVYALMEEVGTSNEEPQRNQEQPQRQEPPATPQAAPPNSTVLVPESAFPGGVLTGVVIGPDDKPVPNTPVEIAGGVPANLTGTVTGEQPTPPCSANDPACQQQGQTPGASRPPVDCASQFHQAGEPLMSSSPRGDSGSMPSPAPAPAVTDAAGRFAICMPPNSPQVSVGLPGGSKTTVPAVTGTPALPSQPPSFFQPNQRISIIGVLRDIKADQGGRTWLLPAVNAWSPNGDQVVTAFQTPRDLAPGPANISYTGGDNQTHQVPGTVFRIVRAYLDRTKLHSDQGAAFEYTVQFAGQPGQSPCVEMHVAGPVVLVQAPPEIIAIDANGLGTFGGKIRATQVTAGAVVPFDLKPNIHVCGQ